MPIGQFLSNIGKRFIPQVASTSARTPSFMPDDGQDEQDDPNSPYGADEPPPPPPVAEDDAGPLTPRPMRSAASAMSAPPPPPAPRMDDAGPTGPSLPRSAASAMSQPSLPPPPVPPAPPNTPGGQKIGLGRQIGGALIQGAGMLFPPAAGATRAIGEKVAQGSYPEQERQYERQVAQQQTQAALAKEQAATKETEQRGKLYGQQADTLAVEGKRGPAKVFVPFGKNHDGIMDGSTGKILQEPTTQDPADYIEINPEKGKALGLQPDKQGNYRIPKEGIGPFLTGQVKPPPTTSNEYEGVLKEFTGPDGKVDYVKANSEYDKRLSQRAINSRPPSNTQDNFNTRRSDQSYQFNAGELNKAGKAVEDLNLRMGRLQDTLAQNTPQADALVAPELLTVMAGGQGSGLRMNEAEIARVIGGRSNWESLKASINKWQLDPKAALSITPAQRLQIRALVQTVGKKLADKQALLDDARTKLQSTDDPKDHRRIVADTRTALTHIDQAGDGAPATATVDPKVKAYADQYFGGDIAKAQAAIEAQRSGRK